MKILILGLNYAPEMVGIAVYSTGLAESLVERGHSVAIVAGKPYYPGWLVPEAFLGRWRRQSREAGVDVTRVAHYVPSKPTGLRRILHHFSFAASCLLPCLFKARQLQPDVVIAIAPSLIAASVAWLASRLTGAKCVLHIQDFEVEAAIATGLISGRGFFSAVACGSEKFILKRFDVVSSISSAMCLKLVEKGLAAEKIAEFRNWADIDGVRPLERQSAYRVEWCITTPHVALYSGNIANKQGIEIVIDAARRLRHRDDLTFVICGEGPNRANLETQASGLPNVRFHNLQPKDKLGELLGLASVHLLPQLGDAADLVLPSKLTNMLASGRPIVATANHDTGLASEVKGCGIVVQPEDGFAFAAAIEALLDDKTVHATFAVKARTRAEARWEREAIIDDYENLLMELTGKKSNDNVDLDCPPTIYQDLSRFSVTPGFRGRSGIVVLLWQLVQGSLFRLSPQPFYGWRRFLLRLFGAQVGNGVLIRPTSRVTYPWKVAFGDYCWIGDDAEIYSLGAITIGANAVVSQRTYLCAGSHDPSDIAFPLVAKPIVIAPECWIATDCFVAPGVTIGRGTIVAARSTVLADLPEGVIAAGAPATVRKQRPFPT